MKIRTRAFVSRCGRGVSYGVVLGLLFAAVGPVGCKKTVMPSDAKAVLTKALDALKAKNVDG